jgi:Tfp pilus assembly protein PilF
MKYFISKFASVLIYTSTIFIFQAREVKAEDINKIAKEVTVQIVNQYDTGSGVIIKHNANIYTVLTVNHVLLKNAPNEENIPLAAGDKLEVITPDNQPHLSNIDSIKRFPGVDLAILQFISDKNYRVIEIGDSTIIKRGFPFSVAGFPLLPGSTKTSFQSISGVISAKATQPLKNGYALAYLNETYRGMSGGPLIDQQGLLIGIHGYAYSPYSDNGGIIPSPLPSSTNFKVALNMAIPINTFLSLAPQVDKRLGLKASIAETKSKEMLADDYLLQAVVKATSHDYTKDIEAFFNQTQKPESTFTNNKALLTDALKSLDIAIQLSPDYDLAYAIRGFIYGELGNENLALEDIGKAIDLNPNVPIYYFLRVSYSSKIGNQRSDMDKWLSLSHNDAPIQLGKALEFLSQNNLQEALNALNFAIQLDPEYDYAYFLRGFVRQNLGDCEGALKDIQMAAKLTKESSDPISQVLSDPKYETNMCKGDQLRTMRTIGSKFGYLESKAVDILAIVLMKDKEAVKDIFTNRLSQQGQSDIILYLLYELHFLSTSDFFDPENAPEKTASFRDFLNLSITERKTIAQETENILNKILSGLTLFEIQKQFFHP